MVISISFFPKTRSCSDSAQHITNNTFDLSYARANLLSPHSFLHCEFADMYCGAVPHFQILGIFWDHVSGIEVTPI